MKRITLLAVLGFCLAVPSLVVAQSEYNHAEVGVFADYFRFSTPNPNINFVGVGGRIAANVRPSIQLEGEMNYDFRRNVTSTFDNGITTSFVTTRVRPLTGLFGPKFQAGASGPFHAFVTGKLGFINFSNQAEFATQVNNVTVGNTHVAFYPGGGIEGFWGAFGLRLEAGDEIYLANGAHNNLRVTFGPTFRF